LAKFNSLKEFLDFHQGEKRGIIAIVFIMLITLLVMAAMPYLVKPEVMDQSGIKEKIADYEHYRDSVLEARLAEKERKKSTPKSWSYDKQPKTSKPKSKTIERFYFDPNTASDEEWSLLGLNSGQIRTINKYLSKGGQFRKPEDLTRMYAIPKEQANELIPYVKLTNEESLSLDSLKQIPNKPKASLQPHSIDLNSADTSEFKLINGIGSFYANKIVDYRNELGGYASLDQLKEIWKFDQEKFDLTTEYLVLIPESQLRFDINHCHAEELAAHPYFRWKVAKAVIAYREQHGGYTSTEDLKKIHLINQELWLKIAPYLKIVND